MIYNPLSLPSCRHRQMMEKILITVIYCHLFQNRAGGVRQYHRIKLLIVNPMTSDRRLRCFVSSSNLLASVKILRCSLCCQNFFKRRNHILISQANHFIRVVFSTVFFNLFIFYNKWSHAVCLLKFSKNPINEHTKVFEGRNKI